MYSGCDGEGRDSPPGSRRHQEAEATEGVPPAPCVCQPSSRSAHLTVSRWARPPRRRNSWRCARAAGGSRGKPTEGNKPPTLTRCYYSQKKEGATQGGLTLPPIRGPESCRGWRSTGGGTDRGPQGPSWGAQVPVRVRQQPGLREWTRRAAGVETGGGGLGSLPPGLGSEASHRNGWRPSQEVGVSSLLSRGLGFLTPAVAIMHKHLFRGILGPATERRPRRVWGGAPCLDAWGQSPPKASWGPPGGLGLCTGAPGGEEGWPGAASPERGSGRELGSAPATCQLCGAGLLPLRASTSSSVQWGGGRPPQWVGWDRWHEGACSGDAVL